MGLVAETEAFIYMEGRFQTVVGGEDQGMYPQFPGRVDGCTHQSLADSTVAPGRLHPKFEGLRHAVPEELQHHHSHDLFPRPGQKDAPAACQHPFRMLQLFQVCRFQNVVFLQPGQRDRQQLRLISVLIVDNDKFL